MRDYLNLGLIFGGLGIYVCYALYGVAQERLLTTAFESDEEGGEPVFFKETLFLLFVQTLCNAAAGGIALLASGKASAPAGAEKPAGFMAFALVSASYIGAMFCSNLSLQYIDYPTQVLGKSCKALAVLVVGVLSGAAFPRAKYVSVAFITAGIALFMLQKVGGAHGGAHAADPSAVLVGRALLFGSLACDGITGALQDRLVGRSRPSAFHMMLYNNLWAAIYLGAALVATGRMQLGAEFVRAYPAVLTPIGAFALCSAAGQLFIYYTVRHHGSLACTLVTTTRKFFTILLSVVLFGHSLKPTQWLAVLIVFAGIGGDIYLSAKGKAKPVKKAA